MKHETQPLPQAVAPNDVATHPEMGLHRGKSTDPRWPPGVAGDTTSNDTEPGAAPVDVLDATLQGFRRRPRVEIEEALETNGTDAARGHADPHVPPRRAEERRATARRVIVADEAPPAALPPGLAQPNVTEPNVTQPKVVPLGAPGAPAPVRVPSPEPGALAREEQAHGRMLPTVKRPPLRRELGRRLLLVALGLCLMIGLFVIFSARRGHQRSATKPASTFTAPSLRTEAEAPSATPAIVESNGGPDSAPPASAAATTLTPRPAQTSSPPVRLTAASPASPPSSTHSAEPNRPSPPSDILRSQ